MHGEEDIITTEVEIITYVDESDDFYKNVKVEAASPVSNGESHFYNVSDLLFAK